MDDFMKVRFSHATGQPGNPGSVPDHIAAFWDKADRAYKSMGYPNIPRDHWPLIYVLADAAHQATPAISVSSETEPMATSVLPAPPIDMRTKEGRAMRLATVGAKSGG